MRTLTYCSSFVINADVSQRAVGWTWAKNLGISPMWNTQTMVWEPLLTLLNQNSQHTFTHRRKYTINNVWTHVHTHPSLYLLLGRGVTAGFGHSICTVHPSFSFVLQCTETARTPSLEDRCYLKRQEELELGAVLKKEIHHLHKLGMGAHRNKWNSQEVWKHFSF